MTIGILPNTSKENIAEVVAILVKSLRENGFDYAISSNFNHSLKELPDEFRRCEYMDVEEIFSHCDMVASIGGDGTMLHTAFQARKWETPILGINFGKLGFLAEFDINHMDQLLKEIKEGKFTIDERMVLEGECSGCDNKYLFAINDIVIEKGGWPKMIELSLKVDDDYVTTFAADGLILATPTGSTAYSLSTGGPIVSPQADVITMSPISPHSLTMRPLVLASSHTINIHVSSMHTSVQINCDGQRVYNYTPPIDITVRKSKKHVRLVHTFSTNYFKTLREKLFWGMDLRRIMHP
ncbi:MAG: NAD(+)/NADH kinase [Ignavibacteria bacterium]|jgi:NAD+ kinase|nr:NAD(+)/NADH kinase [Ignavibacteria bacterium]MCU7498293.1 NAD(+)/NADH kinase [Ignavibacteria bacterium]MCU7511215.1 NAD(+)/NADH kinase [Ignavibacteria bacterium]MCU7519063.1 NAD(+)/NADH kinase [Ignavibacteria bacterium]MCU7523344.1 NAD(+)/NADH kinase [Ignavibacteria bacterium]